MRSVYLLASKFNLNGSFKRELSLRNTKCIFPNSPIPQCVNTAKVVDAESTHGAIKEILNPCKKTKVKFEVPTEKFLEDASKEVINRLKETLKEVNLEKLYETNLTNKACIDTITDICHNSKEKFSCRYVIYYIIYCSKILVLEIQDAYYHILPLGLVETNLENPTQDQLMKLL